MKFRDLKLKMDIPFVGLVMLFFLMLIFVASTPDIIIPNLVFGSIGLFILVVVYFTNIKVGLLINLATVSIYLLLILYFHFVETHSINYLVFIWVIINPLLTVLGALVNKNYKEICDNNVTLEKRIIEVATLDERTNLKNYRSFENDVNIYKNIALRYDMDCALLAIGIKHFEEIKKLTTADGVEKIIDALIVSLAEVLRVEDELYILDINNITLGILLLTKKDSIQVVRERIQSRVSQIDLTSIPNINSDNIELTMGYSFTEKNKTTFDLLMIAKDSMD